VLYCFYSSDTEALEACFRLLHDDDDDDVTCCCFHNSFTDTIAPYVGLAAVE